MALEKEQSRQQQKGNNQQHEQAAGTTTSTERCAFRTAHFRSSEDSPSLYTAVNSSVFRRVRLTHSAVVSKEYVERLNNKRSKRRLLGKTTKKEQAASRASVGPKKVESDQKKKNAVWIVRGEAPRDASPVSVIFGVDRGQVFGVVAARATASAAAVAFVMWVPLVAAKPKKHENRFCTYSWARKTSCSHTSPAETGGGDQVA